MNKLNMEDYYFHGLAGNIYFLNTEEVIKVSLQQLSSIINTGGIYSRKLLNDKFDIEYQDNNNFFNGEDYISVCVKNESVEEYNGDFYDCVSSFLRYVKYKIALVIEPDYINESLRKNTYRHMPGERHILKFIPLASIRAVVIGFIPEQDLIDAVEMVLGDLNISIIDIHGNILNKKNKVYVKNK